METFIDLSTVPTHQRVSFWQDYVCNLLVGVDCKVTQPSEFYGSMWSTPFRNGSWNRLRSAGHWAKRTQDRIRRSDDDFFLIYHQLKGRLQIDVDNSNLTIRPGDFLIYDAALPRSMQLVGDVEHIVIKVRREFFHRFIHLPKKHFAHRIDSAQPLAGLIGRMLTDITNSSFELPKSEHEFFGETVLTLINRLIEANHSTTSVITRHTYVFLFEIKRYISSQLDNEDLTPIQIANHFRISHRYVNKLFEAEGCSVTSWVLTQRLERAASLLSKSSHVQQSITDIALSCGFRDPSHFSKAFRSRYSLSPRDYRRLNT